MIMRIGNLIRNIKRRGEGRGRGRGAGIGNGQGAEIITGHMTERINTGIGKSTNVIILVKRVRETRVLKKDDSEKRVQTGNIGIIVRERRSMSIKRNIIEEDQGSEEG